MSATLDYWRGQAGDEYAGRHIAPQVGSTEANAMMFIQALSQRELLGAGAHPIKTVLELGCGTGLNLKALKTVLPWAAITGVEINETAIARAKIAIGDTDVAVLKGSALDFNPAGDGMEQWDLVLSKGFLIHIHPDDLERAYDTIHRSAKKYILLCEYFNPVPVSIPYRGQEGLLWKRDFAGDMLDAYDDLQVVKTGFVSRRDQYPQDDINWTLLEKR